MKNGKKGTYGYIKKQKIKLLLITLFLFAIPLTIFATGLIMTHTRLNLFTFVAILGCLPACKSMVSLIMIFMQKPMPEEKYLETKEAAGDLISAYELVFTAYEHTTPVNALVICGHQVVCYTPDEKTDIPYLEKHIHRILTANGYADVQTKVLKDFRIFLNRVNDLKQNQDSYREGINFKPDSRYPGCSGEELIYHTLLAISL